MIQQPLHQSGNFEKQFKHWRLHLLLFTYILELADLDDLTHSPLDP